MWVQFQDLSCRSVCIVKVTSSIVSVTYRMEASSSRSVASWGEDVAPRWCCWWLVVLWGGAGRLEVVAVVVAAEVVVTVVSLAEPVRCACLAARLSIATVQLPYSASTTSCHSVTTIRFTHQHLQQHASARLQVLNSANTHTEKGNTGQTCAPNLC